MPRETINEVNINRYVLQLDDNLSSGKCNTMVGWFISIIICLLVCRQGDNGQ